HLQAKHLRDGVGRAVLARLVDVVAVDEHPAPRAARDREIVPAPLMDRAARFPAPGSRGPWFAAGPGQSVEDQVEGIVHDGPLSARSGRWSTTTPSLASSRRQNAWRGPSPRSMASRYLSNHSMAACVAGLRAGGPIGVDMASLQNKISGRNRLPAHSTW